MAFLRRPVTKITLSIPEAMHSSTAYWISGLSTTGSISLGVAFVAGRNRVPRPAAGTTALVTAAVVAAPASTMRLSVVIARGWGGPHVLSRGKMLDGTSGTSG